MDGAKQPGVATPALLTLKELACTLPSERADGLAMGRRWHGPAPAENRQRYGSIQPRELRSLDRRRLQTC